MSKNEHGLFGQWTPSLSRCLHSASWRGCFASLPPAPPALYYQLHQWLRLPIHKSWYIDLSNFICELIFLFSMFWTFSHCLKSFYLEKRNHREHYFGLFVCNFVFVTFWEKRLTSGFVLCNYYRIFLSNNIISCTAWAWISSSGYIIGISWSIYRSKYINQGYTNLLWSQSLPNHKHATHSINLWIESHLNWELSESRMDSESSFDLKNRN